MKSVWSGGGAQADLLLSFTHEAFIHGIFEMLLSKTTVLKAMEADMSLFLQITSLLSL